VGALFFLSLFFFFFSSYSIFPPTFLPGSSRWKSARSTSNFAIIICRIVNGLNSHSNIFGDKLRAQNQLATRVHDTAAVIINNARNSSGAWADVRITLVIRSRPAGMRTSNFRSAGSVHNADLYVSLFA